MRKALGWLMLAIGISGIVLSIVGFVVGRRLVDAMGESLRTNLTLTVEGLDTVRESLILTRSTIAQLDDGLETARDAATNVSSAVSETRPLLSNGSDVITQDVPQSIETFQDSLPALIEVASAVDSAMRTLSGFNIDRSILGIPLSFDLGVDYDPEVPFDQSVEELGASLEGVPGKLRDLEQSIDTTNANLLTISKDLGDLGENLDRINRSVMDAQPLLDEYIAIVTDLSDSARQSRLLLERQLAQANIILTVIMVWFGLAQAAPIYLGWELASGSRRSVAYGVDGDTTVTTVVRKNAAPDSQTQAASTETESADA